MYQANAKPISLIRLIRRQEKNADALSLIRLIRRQKEKDLAVRVQNKVVTVV